jgi:peptidoglycan lytic transglycosylase
MNIRTYLGRTPAVLLLLILCWPTPFYAAQADDAKLLEQRKQYLSAKKSLRAGHLKTFKKKAEALKDYPLYGYLRYDYLSRRLWKVKNAEIIDFLKNYGDLPMANDLRKRWLTLLVKRARWQTYVDNYTPQKDKTLQCNQLLARIKTKNESYLLEDIRTVWLTGESLPPQCDPAFARLYKSELMTDELIWQRIRLSMAKGQTSLAAYLARRLGAEKQPWVKRWIAMHRNPSKATYKVKYDDSPVAREILLHGMHRLARQNIKRALSRWQKLKTSYSFSDEEIDQLEHTLTVRAARKNHKQAKQLLDNIANSEVDEQILHLRLSIALEDEDWHTLVKWTQGEPADESIRLRWYYWRARALAETGNVAAATEIYKDLAKERDYYGFLAADRVNMPYQMNYHPLPVDLEKWQKLSALPAIVRARELYQLGSHHSARREWNQALTQLTSYQKQIAASIAGNWGWHDRAILTLAQAKLFDDVVTRFPLPFNKTVLQFAKMRNMDLSWMYALVRAESAFIEDVRSPAGALGLMQVMPATGKITARRIGLRNYNTKQLLQANKNVRLGSAYLKQMYDAFNKSTVLATAAYNAGPANVKRWLPKKHCQEADIWIEKIPFTETRKYVRRILYFASVYDWRLKREIIPIQQRTTLIQPKKQILASKSCPVGKV